MNQVFENLILSEPFLIEASEWILQTPYFKHKTLMTSDEFLDRISRVLSDRSGQVITVTMWELHNVYFDSVRISENLEDAAGSCYVEVKKVPNDFLWWEQVRLKNPTFYQQNKK